MSGHQGRAEQAAERLRESRELIDAGFPGRAVEALHVAAELAVEEWAEREGVTVPPADISPHETRARLAAALRGTGRVPAGFDKLLRRLNDDRKRTKYDDKPSRFDAMTLAQAQASVRIVVESLAPARAEPPAAVAAAPAAPFTPAPAAPPERVPRRRTAALVAAGLVLAIVVVGVALALTGDDEDGAAPDTTRRAEAPARGRPVAAGASGVVRGLTYRVTRTHTGTRLTGGRRARGVFVVAYVSARNPSPDTILPLRLDAFALQDRQGRLHRPTTRVEDLPLAIDASGNTRLELPFDVPRDAVAGARLVIDEVSPSGRSRRPGVAIALPLDDGIGVVKEGSWTGRATDGSPVELRVERGEVVRRFAVRGRTAGGEPCTAAFEGIYFVDGTELAPPGELEVAGRFSTATEVAGEVASAPSASCRVGPLRFSASTGLP